MKTVRFLLIIFLCAASLLYCKAQSDDFKLSVYYLKGEKSKDSYSITTVITVDRNKFTYSKTAEGYTKDKMKDESRTCTFSSEKLDSIKYFIIDNNLNINDSLFDNTTKYKSFEIFTNIVLKMEINGVETKIKINGDISQFKNEPLYSRTVEFISYIEDKIDDCSP